MNRLVRITTGARLHFGLLDVASPFGGCGVMVDRPTTIVEAKPASEFRIVPSNANASDQISRATEIAKRIANEPPLGAGELMSETFPKVEVRIVQAAPSHNGLGSGTQLSMAIAEAILLATSDSLVASPALTRGEIESVVDRKRLIAAADRGRRSAVGTHGYFSGGFVAEGLSANNADTLNELEHHLEMPSSWRAAVLLPKTTRSEAVVDDAADVQTVSGQEEQAKFDRLAAAMQQRDALLQLLSGELIPSIVAKDFSKFSQAVTQYNRSSGELFSRVQGGPYNGPETTHLVESLLASGHRGVGQSSWGPGVFSWFPTPQAAWAFCDGWNDASREPLMVSPQRTGRSVQVEPFVDTDQRRRSV